MDQVIDFFRKLFWAESWPPRWYCGEWTDFHGWLYLLSDLAIWAAYFAIPILLVVFLYKKKRVPFLSILWLFVAFILLCGLTHLIDAVIFWFPAYRLSALIRFVTAIVSWATVISLVKVVPEALNLKTSKEFEAELEKRKASEERFKNLLENAPDALVITNTRGEIVLVNKQCQNVFGYEKEELMGKKIEMLMPDRFAKGHVKNREGFFSNPKLRPMGDEVALWGKRKDGTEFPVEISLSPLNTQGELLVSAAIRDITERKLAKERLEEYNLKLDQKNKELEEFVYVASHDLQEPVRTIISFINLFQDEFGDQMGDDAKHYLTYIQSAGERSQQLIVDLLDYSRLGKNSKLETVDMAKVAQQALDDLDLKIKEKDAEVKVGDLPKLKGYGTGLRLLIQNLVGNAIKFNRPDVKPVIEISAEEQDDAWKFSIKDNGIGFSEEFKDRIFVIFKKLHSRKEYSGTGIGLAHCKKIIELHGGEIWAESVPDEGSSFYFTIPKSINEET